METPVQIVFEDLDSSPEVEQRIRERLRRLERRFAGMAGCHVAVGRPQGQARRGRGWTVRIEVRVPGAELVASRKPGDLAAHEDLLVAVRDAFDVIERELGRRRGEVETGRAPPPARIHALDRTRGCGRIALADGRLVDFHRASVVEPSFDTLALDEPVEVVLQPGEGAGGPRASIVRRLTRGALVAAS